MIACGASYLSVLAILCVTVWVLIRAMNLADYATGIDDANIFFVYAQNLARGHGFVYNIGSEHVEGFTSLLWVLVCMAAFLVASHPEHVLLAVSLVIVSFSVTLCIRSWPIRSESGESWLPWAAAFVVLLFSDWRYTAWNTVTLMDNAFWGSSLTIACVLAIDRQRSARFIRRWLTALIVGLTLTRPEALVWVPVIVSAQYFDVRARLGPSEARRHVAPGALAFLVTALLLTSFRLYYFGFPFPNTFYAKVSPSIAYDISEGSEYLRGFLFSNPAALTCAVVAAVVLIRTLLHHSGTSDRRLLSLSVFALTGLLLPVLTGGDHFVGFRFYQHVYPILLLSLIAFGRFNVLKNASFPLIESRRHVWIGSAAAALVMSNVVPLLGWNASSGLVPFRIQFEIAREGRDVGQFARGLFSGRPELPSIGVISAGGVKYSYPGEVVDLMGLNNTQIAHNGGMRFGVKNHAAFEPATFYSLQPAILNPRLVTNGNLDVFGRSRSFDDRVLAGVTRDARFLRSYEFAEIRLATADSHTALGAWYRNDLLGALETSGDFRVIRVRRPS